MSGHLAEVDFLAIVQPSLIAIRLEVSSVISGPFLRRRRTQQLPDAHLQPAKVSTSGHLMVVPEVPEKGLVTTPWYHPACLLAVDPQKPWSQMAQEPR